LENNTVPSENGSGLQIQPGPPSTKQPKQLLKAGFLMLTSAVLGGVAFAIWNKHQITTMKENSANREEAPIPGADDDAIY